MKKPLFVMVAITAVLCSCSSSGVRINHGSVLSVYAHDGVSRFGDSVAISGTLPGSISDDPLEADFFLFPEGYCTITLFPGSDSFQVSVDFDESRLAALWERSMSQLASVPGYPDVTAAVEFGSGYVMPVSSYKDFECSYNALTVSWEVLPI